MPVVSRPRANPNIYSKVPVKIKAQEEETWYKKYNFVISLIIFLLLLAIIIILFKVPTVDSKFQTCGDGTFYGTCSLTKPYYCDNGTLAEKASVCGCVDGANKAGETCVSEYNTNPQEITLNYIFEGEEKNIGFIAYGGLVDYLSGTSRVISYENSGKPARADFKLKDINEENQRALLLPLVIEIQNLAEKKEDQARIAISLVQNIEYGFSDKTERFFSQTINYSRYPYEVLYENQGICGEKSGLLAFLLKEIGYGVVIFYNQPENHEAVGISCPIGESYWNTGYCFVETTGPVIITDDSIEYVGGVVLDSEPEVILISNGDSLPANLKEYRDAETMKRLREGKFVLFSDSKLEKLIERYGLVEDYFVE
jgi:hypothetical protein